jgi:hypothetical protein
MAKLVMPYGQPEDPAAFETTTPGATSHTPPIT